MTSNRHAKDKPGAAATRSGGRPWDSDTALDARRAREIIRRDVPALSPNSVVSIGEGWSSYAFLVDDRWIFRFPKRSEVQRKLELEVALLPELQQTLAVELPVFTHVLQSGHYPFTYAAYRRIEGVFAWDLEDNGTLGSAAANSCGRFLTRLHRFLRSSALSAGCEEQVPTVAQELVANARAAFERLDAWPERDRYRVRLDHYLDELDFDRLGTPDKTTVVHGDLLPDHLLFDPRSLDLIGVIDWGEVRIDDPAWDFSGLYYWGGRGFVEEVLTHYECTRDPGMLERARLIALEVGLGDVWYGIEEQLPRYYSVGVRCLEHCLAGKEG